MANVGLFVSQVHPPSFFTPLATHEEMVGVHAPDFFHSGPAPDVLLGTFIRKTVGASVGGGESRENRRLLKQEEIWSGYPWGNPNEPCTDEEIENFNAVHRIGLANARLSGMTEIAKDPVQRWSLQDRHFELLNLDKDLSDHRSIMDEIRNLETYGYPPLLPRQLEQQVTEAMSAVSDYFRHLSRYLDRHKQDRKDLPGKPALGYEEINQAVQRVLAIESIDDSRNPRSLRTRYRRAERQRFDAVERLGDFNIAHDVLPEKRLESMFARIRRINSRMKDLAARIVSHRNEGLRRLKVD